MNGTVTDIHRTSVVDGPGLRTTVFLKGCPLQCVWCHNPETQRRGREMALDPSKCDACGHCVPSCPAGALEIRGGRVWLDRSRCDSCGQCAAVCPTGAFFIYGRVMTDDEVVAEVVKDRDYFEASGGGVTVSGGEPTAQPDFALSILRKCRRAGIRTALDTSGFFPRELGERSLEVTDLYLFDYKATGDELHLRLTGVPRERVTGMLEFLLARGAHIILRCPMIPGVNDHEDHLAAIADFEQSLPSLEAIDILPWHTMGNSKYARLGRPVPDGLPAENAPETTKEAYRAFFSSRGCCKVKVC